jgi:hypothetical protein
MILLSVIMQEWKVTPKHNILEAELKFVQQLEVDNGSALLLLVSAKPVTYVWKQNLFIAGAIMKKQRKVLELRRKSIAYFN